MRLGHDRHINASALAFGIAITVFVARRPDILSNAHLWAEDGRVWFQEAYNLGIAGTLFSPHTGYLQSFSRLIFGVAQALPLEWVPLFANLAALVVRAALPAFLFSSRFDWVDPRARIVILAYYLLMPHLGEVHANITNTHWYLGLYLLMLVLADPPPTRTWTLHDFAVLIVAGLSGPFILAVLPCWLLRETARAGPWPAPMGRARHRLLRPFPLLMLALAILQAGFILYGYQATRPSTPLGASPLLFAEILVSRVFVGFIYHSGWLRDASTVQSLPAAIGVYLATVAIFAAAGAVIAFEMIQGNWRPWCVALYAAIILGLTLAKPVISLTEPQWPVLLAGGGERYFVAINICWFVILVFFVGQISRQRETAVLVAGSAIALLALLPAFRIAPVEGADFRSEVQRFNAARPGERVEIAIAPKGWSMTLTKK